MSVLIKGMEMPVQCASCALWTMAIIKGKGIDFCQAAQKKMETRYGRRPDWCPMIEVPEPHGRLIDADALVRESPYPPHDVSYDYIDMAEKVIIRNKIYLAPTVIPASEEAE